MTKKDNVMIKNYLFETMYVLKINGCINSALGWLFFPDNLHILLRAYESVVCFNWKSHCGFYETINIFRPENMVRLFASEHGRWSRKKSENVA